MNVLDREGLPPPIPPFPGLSCVGLEDLGGEMEPKANTGKPPRGRTVSSDATKGVDSLRNDSRDAGGIFRSTSERR